MPTLSVKEASCSNPAIRHALSAWREHHRLHAGFLFLVPDQLTVLGVVQHRLTEVTEFPWPQGDLGCFYLLEKGGSLGRHVQFIAVQSSWRSYGHDPSNNPRGEFTSTETEFIMIHSSNGRPNEVIVHLFKQKI